MNQTQLNRSVVGGVKGYDVPIFATAKYKLTVKPTDGPNSVVKFEKRLFESKSRLLRIVSHNSGWFLDLIFLHPSHIFNLVPLHFLRQPHFLLPEVRLKQLLSSLVQVFLFVPTVLIVFLNTRLSISHKFQLLQLLLLTLPFFNFLAIEVGLDEVPKSRPISLIFSQHILMNLFEISM